MVERFGYVYMAYNAPRVHQADTYMMKIISTNKAGRKNLTR